MPRAARCGSSRKLRIETQPYPHTVTSYFDFGFGLACSKPTRQAEQVEQSCSPACTGPAWSQDQIVVFDPGSLELLLSISITSHGLEDEPDMPAITFALRGDSVRVLGAGCDKIEPIRK